MMADSDEEGIDFSNALLETVDDIEDPFSFNDAPVTKRRRAVIGKNGSVEDLDLFSNESPVKSRLSGSSFKNMGNLTQLQV
jgi:hypothetical protein